MIYYDAVWGERTRNELFRALSNPRRRLVIHVARERMPAPVSLSDFVDAIVDEFRGREGITTSPARDSVHTELVHVHVPWLVERDLVTYDPTREEITATAHPAYHDAGVRAILERAADASESPDDLFDALASGRRRIVLSHLRNRGEPVGVEWIARAVVARESDATADSSVDDALLERVHTSLVHVHLPRLRDAGLVAYDESGDVYYRGDAERYLRFVRSRPAHVLDGGFPLDSTAESR